MKIHRTSCAGVAEQVDELIGLLGRYVRRHRELRELVRQRRELDVHEDGDFAEELGDVEQEILADIGLLERDRIAKTARLAEALESPSTDGMRLAELLSHVEDDQRDRLLDLREDLRELADELDRLRSSRRGVHVQALEHRQLYLAVVPGRDPSAALSELPRESGSTDAVDDAPLFPPEDTGRRF